MSRRNGDHCGLCGVWLKNTNAHRCAPGVYRGIDAANSHAWNRELDETSLAEHNLSVPTTSDRLRDGFQMLGDDEHS